MINLPQGQGFILPEVPDNMRSTSPEVYKYLVDLRRNTVKILTSLVDNDTTLQSAINTGASGTYPSTGVSYIFVNGIFTSTV